MIHSPLRFLPRIVRKSRPVHLTVFLTRRCNARCAFCFYLRREGSPAPEGSAAPPEGHNENELTHAELERFSRSMGSLLWLAFSGGEIFLRPDLLEISRTFYNRCKPTFMLYPTNGLLPERIAGTATRLAAECPRSVVAVKLSLDGVGAMHDELRGVPGAFDRVLESLAALRPLLARHPNFELGVNTVFSARNQDSMDGIMDFVAGLEGVRTHTVSLVRGDLGDRSFAEVDPEKYLASVVRLERASRSGAAPRYGFHGAGIKAAQDVLQRRIIHRALTTGQTGIPCYAGRLNLVLTESGDLYPCENFTEAMHMGNIRDAGHGARALLDGASAGRVLARIRAGCSCTHECYAMTNILFNPRLYPRLLAGYMGF